MMPCGPAKQNSSKVLPSPKDTQNGMRMRLRMRLVKGLEMQGAEIR